MEQEHKRRVRYSGTHPRTFREKYKELNPEKYQQDVEKIRQKGRTPAGTHIPICVEEILDFLDVRPGQIGLDATLGYGGHSRKLLEKLNGQGHLYAIDVDPVESEKTRLRLNQTGYGPELLTVRCQNFAALDQVSPAGLRFDFVLADLGVSSMQLDNPERGFTFKQDGPLDLRLDQTSGIPASLRLKELSRDELASMLWENADEPYAEEIAEAIHRRLKKGRLDTTRQLADTVAEALAFLPAKEKKQDVKKACQRVFQALRIDINNEFEVLYRFLELLPTVLAPGGKAAILTFHSGEDRLVKKSFQSLEREGIYQAVAKEVIRPSTQECFQNPRARSAKLRWAIKAE